jgi:tetratricopeptide (TPR) repeat protein
MPQPAAITVGDALRRAHAHWDAGHAREAEALCLQVVAAVPSHPDALHLLGIMAHAYGRRDVAVDLLARACASPDATATHHSNRAEVCRQAGRLADAEAAARRAVALDPALTDAWSNLGIVLQERGRLAESLACLEQVAALRPHMPLAHNNLANTLLRLGHVERAESHYRRALALQPDYAETHSNLAVLLRQRGDLVSAEAHARQAIALEPLLADAYRNLAGIQQAVQDAKAAQHNVAARSLSPLAGASPPAPADAALAAWQAAEREARALLGQQRFAQAQACLAPLLADGRGPIVLWQLMAAALRPQGRIEETRAIQQMIADMVPGHLAARFDLAETLLLLGDFERGWREYRHRYSLPHTLSMERKMQQPRWMGEPIAGRTLLIHDEQGFGDAFQFLRMVPWARARSGARVILQTMPEVLPLARRAEGFDVIAARDELPPAFDLHCELMSLPMALGLSMADLPGKVPYLRADPARVTMWRERLGELPRPWVALVWAGRPTHHNDANRSLALSTLAPLARAGASFVSLQKGGAAAQAAVPPADMRLYDVGEAIEDFDDTAAILELADLLISVDSSPVHLAGALGRPVWTLLPFVPDWRWLLEREDTPWYPTMRLFRQTRAGDWDEVIERVAQALCTWTGRAVGQVP